jgi:hypothetical protein
LEPTPLACEKIVYRTITRASDFRDGYATAYAFHRRPIDTDGLSVDFDVAVPDGCGAGLSGKRAIVSLHVGCVRGVSPLDVIQDEPTHANIVGMPFYSDDSRRELAEQLATLLAEQARPAWQRPAKA